MDQIKTLYDELVKYDPSLAQNKDAVLQVIKKMVAAKPVVQVDNNRKESFGEKLQDHIARNRVYLSPASNRFALWISKWSLSIASFWVALLIVGAGYYWIQIGSQSHIAKSPRVVKQDLNVSSSGESAAMMRSDSSGLEDEGDAALAAVDVEEEDILSLPPKQTNVRALVDINESHEASTQITFSQPTNLVGGMGGETSMSTELDIAATSMMKDVPQYDSMGGIGGGVGGADPRMIGQNIPSTSASSMIAPDMMQNHLDGPDVVNKRIALVITDTQGLLFDTPALEIVAQYGVAITIIPYNTAQAEKLQEQGFPLADPLKSSSQKGVVYIDTTDIQNNPDLLRKIIERYQSEGYTFIEVSTTK